MASYDSNFTNSTAVRPRHYRRPVERPFRAEERNRTTILFGGLTRKHEHFIKAVFEGSGYTCEILPTPDLNAFHIGREYCNNGQCNPVYFTTGSLIQYLTNLEAQGLSRHDIVDRYLFFTAGCCGPCRFGMYDAEYRLALDNAGFGGFRVVTFQQDDGVRGPHHEHLELRPLQGHHDRRRGRRGRGLRRRLFERGLLLRLSDGSSLGLR